MISAKIKAFFAARTKRETAMLCCIAACALAVWASSMASRSAGLRAEFAEVSKRVAQAETALNMEAKITARLEKLRGIIDKSKTLDASALQIAVEKCAREAGVEFSLSSPSSASAGDFKINKISLSTTPQPLHAIAKLESLLARLEPYAAVVESSITGDGRGGASARLIISSFN